MPTAFIPQRGLLVMLLGAMIGCGGESGTKDSAPPPPPVSPKRLTIICTTPVLHEIALRLTDGSAEVTCLLRPGDHAHAWNLHAADFHRLQHADLVFLHGMGVDDAMHPTITTTAKGARLIHMGDHSPVRLAHPTPEPQSPQGWVHPSVHAALVAAMRDTLAEVDPARKDQIDELAAQMIAESKALSPWIASGPGKVAGTRDEAQRTIVTNDPVAAQLIGLLGFRAVLVELAVDQPLTQRDRKRVLDAATNSGTILIAIDPAGHETVAQMIEDISRSTGAAPMRGSLRHWPGDEGYVAFMKEHLIWLAEEAW